VRVRSERDWLIVEWDTGGGAGGLVFAGLWAGREVWAVHQEWTDGRAFQRGWGDEQRFG
jgi:hypothetical protein